MILIKQWKSNHSAHNKTKTRLWEIVTKTAKLPVPIVLHLSLWRLSFIQKTRKFLFYLILMSIIRFSPKLKRIKIIFYHRTRMEKSFSIPLMNTLSLTPKRIFESRLYIALIITLQSLIFRWWVMVIFWHVHTQRLPCMM